MFIINVLLKLNINQNYWSQYILCYFMKESGYYYKLRYEGYLEFKYSLLSNEMYTELIYMRVLYW
jgi:hypothetical protein